MHTRVLNFVRKEADDNIAMLKEGISDVTNGPIFNLHLHMPKRCRGGQHAMRINS